MTLGRLLAAWVGTLTLTTAAAAASVEAPYDEPIQYALESLTSGISTTARIRGTEVIVIPIRTWKSVSGHYCRRYEIKITEPGSQPLENERTRCRETTGIWKPIAED
jgi:surface antigen